MPYAEYTWEGITVNGLECLGLKECNIVMDSELQCNGDLVTINNHKMHIYRKGNKDNPPLVFMSGGGTVSPVYDFKVYYDKLIDYFTSGMAWRLRRKYKTAIEIRIHLRRQASMADFFNLVDRWKGLSSLQRLPIADMGASDTRPVLIFDGTDWLF